MVVSAAATCGTRATIRSRSEGRRRVPSDLCIPSGRYWTRTSDPCRVKATEQKSQRTSEKKPQVTGQARELGSPQKCSVRAINARWRRGRGTGIQTSFGLSLRLSWHEPVSGTGACPTTRRSAHALITPDCYGPLGGGSGSGFSLAAMRSSSAASGRRASSRGAGGSTNSVAPSGPIISTTSPVRAPASTKS